MLLDELVKKIRSINPSVIMVIDDFANETFFYDAKKWDNQIGVAGFAFGQGKYISWVRKTDNEYKVSEKEANEITKYYLHDVFAGAGENGRVSLPNT